MLAGARETMARDRPLLSVELLADAEFDTVAQLLAELNYRSLTLRPGLDVEVASEPSITTTAGTTCCCPPRRFPTACRH